MIRKRGLFTISKGQSKIRSSYRTGKVDVLINAFEITKSNTRRHFSELCPFLITKNRVQRSSAYPTGGSKIIEEKTNTKIIWSDLIILREDSRNKQINGDQC